MERSRINSSFSVSSVGEPLTQQQQQQNLTAPPTQLRPLPGYVLPKGSTPMPSTIGAPAKLAAAAPTTATRYLTRERLYYETDAEVAQFKLAGDKPVPVMERLAEDAPPASSFREIGTLTPERRYASSKEEVSVKAPGPPFSLMETEETAMASEGNWVTVFGFGGTQTSAVLEYFKKLGVVEGHEMGQGNWIHLKYSTLWAAQKALAKNGSVLAFAGSCMIGVIPTQRAMDQVSKASDSFMSPLKKEFIRRGSHNGEEAGPSDIFLKSGLFSPRPPTDTEGEVIFTHGASISSKTPKGESCTVEGGEPSVVSRALGYVFGW